MIKLNLASHGDNREGFINIDFDHPTADLKADVTDLPFQDDSVDVILAYHILEHFRAGEYEPHLANPLNPKTAMAALGEWRRVLKPGGKLEIKVPDFEKIVWLYYNYPQWARSESSVNAPFASYSDWIISNGQHQCLFDKRTMTKLLTVCGFTNITFLDGQPVASINRANLEMYVVCSK
jgi:predicted SAM-dependent methyltransferase